MFITNFFSVFEQVVILFLLIGLGFLFNKTNRLSQSTCKHLSEIVVSFVTPCVIITSFIREYNPEQMKKLLLVLGIAAGLHIVMYFVSKLIFRFSEEKKRRILVVASMFANAGFFGLPLQQAILGADGVFYGAAYVVMFNIFIWSVGIFEITGDKSAIMPRKVLVSPGMIGIVIGVILFAFSIKPPTVLSSALEHMASLNVPLPMFIIGYYLADADLLQAFRDKRMYLCVAMRLLVYPLLMLAFLSCLPIDPTVAVSMIIASSAPVAAMTTMFSAKYGGDTDLSVKLVTVSTLLSIITIPSVVAFAQNIFK